MWGRTLGEMPATQIHQGQREIEKSKFCHLELRDPEHSIVHTPFLLSFSLQFFFIFFLDLGKNYKKICKISNNKKKVLVFEKITNILIILMLSSNPFFVNRHNHSTFYLFWGLSFSTFHSYSF